VPPAALPGAKPLSSLGQGLKSLTNGFSFSRRDVFEHGPANSSSTAILNDSLYKTKGGSMPEKKPSEAQQEIFRA